MAKIKHIAIATQDPDATVAFYKDVFELEMVGKIDGENAEGYYLSDGNINLAILRFKNEAVTGAFGLSYSGIHHIGFQVDDMSATDAKLQNAESFPMNGVNTALKAGMGGNGHARNVEMKYGGPDGVMIDISQGGWVGTGAA